jgi:hypothetical protein
VTAGSMCTMSPIDDVLTSRILAAAKDWEGFIVRAG